MPTSGSKNSKNQRTGWNIQVSYYAKNTLNLIRNVVEGLKIEPNPEKPLIPLSIGDPTTFGNLKAAEETIEAIKQVVLQGRYNGYGPTIGHEEARQAIAEYVSHQGNVSSKDIIICSGCSSAIDLSITVLADRGQNILIPRPGFPLYKTLADGHDIETRFYNLLPEKNWEVDLQQLETLIDNNTAALIISNPSNPCGSVFTKHHLQQIVNLAEKYFIPIIADEIYEHFVFSEHRYVAVSSLSRSTPVLSCGGLTKRFLVPGWRVGWIVIHDRNNLFREIIIGLRNLSGRIMGANTLIQGALPTILKNTPKCYFDEVIKKLQKSAKIAYKILSEVQGLKPIFPSGAMYMLIGIDINKFPEYRTDLDFVQALVNEESVFCLPGEAFYYPNFMRIVLTVPEEKIQEACYRIAEFCDKHFKRDERIIQSGILNSVNL